MNWFLISLIAPILWTIVNHIDKYLLSKHFKGNGIGAIFIFSSLFSIVVLPIVLIWGHSDIFNLPVQDIFVLIFVGILSALAFYFYLRALDIEESSIVIPLLQMIPIFGFIFGYFILGEVLTKQQTLAGLIIIIGIIILSLEFGEDQKIKIRRKALLFTAISSVSFALHDTLFKKIALVDSFIVSIFWQYLGLFIVGIVAFISIAKYRKQFKEMVGIRRSKLALSLTMGSETLYILGNIANNFATLLAPIALVLVVTSYQPLFVFIGGTLLTLFLPKIATEKISPKHLTHKLLSIVIIVIGSYLLYSSAL